MENAENRRCYAVDKLWTKYRESFNLCRKKIEGDKLFFHEGKKEMFREKFESYYETVLHDCMTSDTKALDVHKQAAISIISAMESEIVTQSCCTADEIAMGPYTVFLNVALSLLLDSIQKKLGKIGQKNVNTLSLPNPFACETPYFEVLTRLLCYEDSKVTKDITYPMAYNIFEWAERFFLLEYITYIENGIEPGLMQEI